MCEIQFLHERYALSSFLGFLSLFTPSFGLVTKFVCLVPRYSSFCQTGGQNVQAFPEQQNPMIAQAGKKKLYQKQGVSKNRTLNICLNTYYKLKVPKDIQEKN